MYNLIITSLCFTGNMLYIFARETLPSLCEITLVDNLVSSAKSVNAYLHLQPGTM